MTGLQLHMLNCINNLNRIPTIRRGTESKKAQRLPQKKQNTNKVIDVGAQYN